MTGPQTVAYRILTGGSRAVSQADQEVQQWRLGEAQGPVGATYVPYDPSVETPDEGGTNGP